METFWILITAFILNKHFPKIQKNESPEGDCLENHGTSSSKFFCKESVVKNIVKFTGIHLC